MLNIIVKIVSLMFQYFVLSILWEEKSILFVIQLNLLTIWNNIILILQKSLMVNRSFLPPRSLATPNSFRKLFFTTQRVVSLLFVVMANLSSTLLWRGATRRLVKRSNSCGLLMGKIYF